ncbi:DUF4817 domain-containing protein [Trichonephila clavipes]|nr:DUF4817 domain-containing protein [Trichonephila clavipes]
MRDSSVKITPFNYTNHTLLSSHHWWQRRLWFCVRGRPSNGRLADTPICCIWRRMLNRVPRRMDFTEINSSGKRGELLGRIDRQNSCFSTAKFIIIKFGLHASFVELESAKNAFNEELWFQQDGATCQTARATIDLLKETFGDSLISRFEPVNWPSRSCDLTPLHYFLWGYVKSLVYADKTITLDHLEDNICRVIADIRPQMLVKVIENWTSRLDYIGASRGSPMPEIIFKM